MAAKILLMAAVVAGGLWLAVEEAAAGQLVLNRRSRYSADIAERTPAEVLWYGIDGGGV